MKNIKLKESVALSDFPKVNESVFEVIGSTGTDKIKFTKDVALSW